MKQTHFGLYVKFPTFLPDLNQVSKIWTYFPNVPNIKCYVSLFNDGGVELLKHRRKGEADVRTNL